MKMIQHEGCEARRYGSAPAFNLSCFKGDSSSTTQTPVNNNQVATQGGGSATGAATASGTNSKAASGTSSAALGGQSNAATAAGATAINNASTITTGSKSTVTVTNNTTTSDPDVTEAALAAEQATTLAAINANTAVTANAIATTTAATTQNATILSTAVTNFQTLISQGIAAITSSQPQVAQLAQAPQSSAPIFVYTGAGSTPSAIASSSPDTTDTVASDGVQPAAPASTGTTLSNGQLVGIAGLAVGVIALIIVLKD